jgi:hypothetical protein
VFALKCLREAPINNADAPPAFNAFCEHIPRLQVAVQHATSMRVRNAAEHLKEEGDPLTDRELRLTTRRRQRLALHDGHRKEWPTIGRTSGVVDRDDRGVIEPRQRNTLGLEAAERAGGVEFRAKDFHCAADRRRLRRLGDVHDTVRALTEACENAMARKNGKRSFRAIDIICQPPRLHQSHAARLPR